MNTLMNTNDSTYFDAYADLEVSQTRQVLPKDLLIIQSTVRVHSSGKSIMKASAISPSSHWNVKAKFQLLRNQWMFLFLLECFTIYIYQFFCS